MTCATCGGQTVNVYRLCDACRADRTRTECESSSAAVLIADPIANARLARLLIPTLEQAS